MIGGVLYTSTSLSQVAAIDAATGETKWVFDPRIYENGLGIPPNLGWLHRGVAYWRKGDDERIIMLTAFAQCSHWMRRPENRSRASGPTAASISRKACGVRSIPTTTPRVRPR